MESTKDVKKSIGIKCKNCSLLKLSHHAKSTRNNQYNGKAPRAAYYCQHPNSNKASDYRLGFVGFGEANYQSPLALKTTPIWCPLKNVDWSKDE